MHPHSSLFSVVTLLAICNRECSADESDLDILSEILPSPGALSVTVVPYMCNFSRVPNRGAYTVASFDSYEAAHYPDRALIVFCGLDAEFISIWEYLYVKYIRLYGPRYFSVLDLTRNTHGFDFSSSEVIAGPFSYLRYVPHNETLRLYVDSDFRGARKSWTPIEMARKDLHKEPLFSMMFYEKSVHDGKMRMQLAFKKKALQVEMIPLYATNYSEPGEVVYSATEGVARSTVKSHFPTFVPLLLDNHVAIYLNPKVVNSNYILLEPFAPVIWATIFSFSVAIAIIMTWSLPKPQKMCRAVFLVDNVIFTFCQMFTSVKLPPANKFFYVSAALTSVFWTLLCMIPLTGYRSSLASLLQKPPRDAKHTAANLDWKFEDKLVGRRRPNISTFLGELREGDFWVEGSRSINFLLSQWGLRQATYSVPLDPPSLEMYSFQCLQRKAQNFIYACRNTQWQMRILFDNNVIMPWLNSIQRDHIKNTSNTENSFAPRHPDKRIDVKGPMYKEDYENRDILALKLQVVIPFFTIIALGVSLASTLFFLEFVVDAIDRRVARPVKRQPVLIPRPLKSCVKSKLVKKLPRDVRISLASLADNRDVDYRVIQIV